jgi:uncharacterized membrane protein
MSTELIVFIGYIVCVFGAWVFIRTQKQNGNDIDNFGGIILMLFPLTNMVLTGVLIIYLLFIELIGIRILHVDKWTWNKFWGI